MHSTGAEQFTGTDPFNPLTQPGLETMINPYFTDDETQVKGDITCPEHTARKGQCYGPGLTLGCRRVPPALTILPEALED